MIAFGPVPSRRLGRSLGVNNIPAKICSYGCVYCQLGRTIVKRTERKAYYEPETVYEDVRAKVEKAKEEGIEIDYLTFVPDGEPTLDINLGKEREMLSSLGIKIAIITNSSLLWRDDVRSELADFDYISVKLDAVSDELWREIDRPEEHLSHHRILEGMLELGRSFGGKMVTETMLVAGVDYSEEAESIGDFLKELGPDAAYISVPIRPPAEEWATIPEESVINSVFQSFHRALGDRVEYLIGYEGNDFARTGDPEKDILAITSVHPMRDDAVDEFLKNAGADRSLIDRMISEKKLVALRYDGHTYIMRKIASRIT